MIYRSLEDLFLFIMFHKWCHLCALMHGKYVWETEGCFFLLIFVGGDRVVMGVV